MRTHEGKTRFVKPGYEGAHRASEDRPAGFRYGLKQKFVTFAEVFTGSRRSSAACGLLRRYRGLSDQVAQFFNLLHDQDVAEREYVHRITRGSYDTISMYRITQYEGRHRLHENTQWPTMAQALP
jgi:hypothetical protein